MTVDERFPKAKAFAAAFDGIDWNSKESVDAVVRAMNEALAEAELEDKAYAERIMQVLGKW